MVRRRLQAAPATTRSWAELVEAGRKAARFQWKLGDLAGEVHCAYGEHSLARYADEIGVEHVRWEHLGRTGSIWGGRAPRGPG